MNDPLYEMSPDDEFWWPTMEEEAESLFNAIVQQDDARRNRKIAELHAAFHKLDALNP